MEMKGLIIMKIEREFLHTLLDKIPEEKYTELLKILFDMSIPEVTPTPDEIEAIERAREEFARGEFISFASAEEMMKYFMSDDFEEEDNDVEKEARG